MRLIRTSKLLELFLVYIEKFINLCCRKPRFTASVILVIIMNILVIAYASTTFHSTSIKSVGAIESLGVDVYWDENCSQPVTVIDWGTIYPGSTKNVTIYVVNEGNVPVTISLRTENWDPVSAMEYMNLTWSYRGEEIYPAEKLKLTLTLEVSANINNVNSFSFDIIISAFG